MWSAPQRAKRRIHDHSSGTYYSYIYAFMLYHIMFATSALIDDPLSDISWDSKFCRYHRKCTAACKTLTVQYFPNNWVIYWFFMRYVFLVGAYAAYFLNLLLSSIWQSHVQSCLPCAFNILFMPVVCVHKGERSNRNKKCNGWCFLPPREAA